MQNLTPLPSANHTARYYSGVGNLKRRCAMARRQYAPCGSVAAAVLWSLLTVTCGFIPSLVRAQDPAAEVQTRIAAGEFGPALATAGGVHDPALRDKLLGNIAI